MIILFFYNKDAKYNYNLGNKLSKKQIQSLTDEIVKLWYAFNFVPDFPEGLPAENKYKLLVDYFEHKTNYVSQGYTHFEFCTYDPASCPFPEKSVAAKILKQMAKKIFLSLKIKNTERAILLIPHNIF